MEYSEADGKRVLTLSRRNLLTLLAKLDGYPPGSACMIEKDGLYVKAEEDHIHYSDRPPGEMHEWTEAKLRSEEKRVEI